VAVYRSDADRNDSVSLRFWQLLVIEGNDDDSHTISALRRYCPSVPKPPCYFTPRLMLGDNLRPWLEQAPGRALNSEEALGTQNLNHTSTITAPLFGVRSSYTQKPASG
jgi:hypothetical protein